MKARLIGSSFQQPSTEISLNQLPIVLGRSSEAGIRLSDVWVSRRHCQLDQDGGALIVRDLGSKHGTFVNGARVEQAVLMPGDELIAGTTSFTVQYQPAATHAASAAALAESN